ncbi:HTH DNA binding domain-containing protein [Rhizobium sp. RU20A]|uniref:RHE_PE00001 family protein n=1 Tax=Rhizobium sp. RU20A TaxID=1907412 RepID=UPI0009572F90|nr:RHE_PE00001 family protein [Rhizobium sp. RU20A]SIR21823.1 HTH DNA binding domain-containing protein [Rhizobium sp. RU20A]
MRYDLSNLPITSLLRPISDTASVLSRLDERIARSPVGVGWIERMHFTDACASLWIDGELVHLEDLVLHDAGADIRAPTHELTVARDVLRSRRRIAAQPSGWALSPDGLRRLRGEGSLGDETGEAATPEFDQPAEIAADPIRRGEGVEPDTSDPLAAELASIDAVLARSDAAIAEAKTPRRGAAREKESLVYDLDWDEDERLEEWRAVLRETDGLPSVLQAIIALDAWNDLQVLQHAPWLGRLLAAETLRHAGLTAAAHLATVNAGLKSIPVERRRHRARDTRLLAIVHGIIAAAELGLKEHDRLTLAKQMMERRLVGRRASSNLPGLIELVISRPLVSAGMVAETLKVTPRAALRIVEELGLREMTGRGRFRAWGIL